MGCYQIPWKGSTQRWASCDLEGIGELAFHIVLELPNSFLQLSGLGNTLLRGYSKSVSPWVNAVLHAVTVSDTFAKSCREGQRGVQRPGSRYMGSALHSEQGIGDSAFSLPVIRSTRMPWLPFEYYFL